MDHTNICKVNDGFTLKKEIYKEIPIYRFVIADKIQTDISDGISLGTCYWFKQTMYKNIINPSTHIIMANTIEEKEYYENTSEFNVILANNNGFINENDYIIKEDIDKKYDLVINSAFQDYKRRYLAKYIPNTIHIGYCHTANRIEIPTYGYFANYKNNIVNTNNYKILNRNEI